MSRYRLEPDETPTESLRRVAAEQLEKGLRELDEEDLHEAVHQVRKRCKKVRALVRLVRPGFAGYAQANRDLRDAARRVSDLRDAEAHLETLGALQGRYGEALDEAALEHVSRALRARRDALAEEHLEGPGTKQLREDLARILRASARWEVKGDAFEAVGGGLARTYGRARERFEDAYDEPTVEAFHEWRKRVKYHRYHVRLLQGCWEGPMRARREALHELSDRLGEAHDLAVLGDALTGLELDGGVGGVIQALIDRRREALRRAARPLARRLFVEDEGALTRRFEAAWRAAREGEADAIRLVE